MKTTFEQFIETNPICVKFRDNPDAKRIFYMIGERKNIFGMMDMSRFGKPALAACVKEIEEFCDSADNHSIDLKDDFTRKMIGRMVKSILEPYGYRIERQKDIPQKVCSKYFSTASCYVPIENSDNFRMVISDDIMEVRKGNQEFRNFHLEYLIKFCVNDDRRISDVIINGRNYKWEYEYPFRSQGNAHLIFLSEYGVWFGLSFDGHKGDMFVNSNPIIDYLIKKLNIDWEIDENYGFEIDADTIFGIIQNSQESEKDKIEIGEVYTGGSEYSFRGVTLVNDMPEQYSYADDAFYIEEGDIECFLYYFLSKHFDGNMSVNCTCSGTSYDAHEFSLHLDHNYYSVPQIMSMLDDIVASTDLLKTDYNKAIELDFAKDFSIFYMTNDFLSRYRMPEKDAIKKHIGNVIDFYKRFVARMKKLIESDPNIKYIVVTGP
ncbi:MAG: hypothetical protein NC184_06805 [Roseburia sp.]|nr:hypothetical protein [Roseburia sp.]